MYQVRSGVSPLLVVMGTNAGKTALWMVPAMVSEAKKTVVILPLLSLLRNVEANLRGRRVPYEIIRDGGGAELERKAALNVNVLVIITETVLLPQFSTILTKLHAAGRLDRIVLDECHVGLCAADYRPKLQRLHKIFTVGAPVLMLTATLGPTHEQDLRNYLGLQLMQTLRHSTYRVNIHYLLRPCSPNTEDVLAAFIKAFRVKYSAQTNRIIVYCRTKNVALNCSRRLNGLAYFHDYENAARDFELFYGNSSTATGTVGQANAPVKARPARTSLDGIVDDVDTTLICATSALSEGVNLPNVRLVVHMDEPYGIVNLVQESGRAGRDDTPAFAVVLTRRAPPNKRLYKDNSERAFYRYLREEDCATLIFSRVFDGVGYSYRMVRATRCNFCLHREGRDSPLLPFFTSATKRANEEEYAEPPVDASARQYNTSCGGDPLVDEGMPL